MDVAKHPTAETMDAFCVPPGVFVKFNPGTWHAGPLFTNPHMDFYNLELRCLTITTLSSDAVRVRCSAA